MRGVQLCALPCASEVLEAAVNGRPRRETPLAWKEEGWQCGEVTTITFIVALCHPPPFRVPRAHLTLCHASPSPPPWLSLALLLAP